MAVIQIKNFAGEVPRMPSRALGGNGALIQYSFLYTCPAKPYGFVGYIFLLDVVQNLPHNAAMVIEIDCHPPRRLPGLK